MRNLLQGNDDLTTNSKIIYDFDKEDNQEKSFNDLNINEIYEEIQGLDLLTSDLINLKLDNKKLIVELEIQNMKVKSKNNYYLYLFI